MTLQLETGFVSKMHTRNESGGEMDVMVAVWGTMGRGARRM